MPSINALRPLDQIIQTLQKNITLFQKKKILAGFDCLIDTFAKPVRKFGANGKCEHFDTIVEFGVFIGEHSHEKCLAPTGDRESD